MPFALLHRDGADHVEVLTGDVVTVPTLADIPLHPGTPVLAVIPYRQIGERGFDCVDDGAPLECLLVRSAGREPLDAFPPGPLTLRDGGFDLSDDEYGRIVEEVLRDEIGHGEGANFVIHRVYEATVEGDPLAAARAAFGRLLTGEQGTYWTFLVDTGERILVGATPERHVSVTDGVTMMNPISGTYRNDGGYPGLLDFLRDPKEIEELYMVLDEELKMMATVAEHGGQVAGPYLKEMARLTHTEYLLAGHGSLDVRDVLRETMFAPTVTGSPIENACRVIARHERRGRRYYAGVLALLDHDEQGRQTLDAPILIRTAEISPDGSLRVPVGATLVRHSTAAGEVAETHTKAAGLLSALGAVPSQPLPVRGTAQTAEVRELLAARNDELARFWLDSRAPGALTVPSLAGRHAVIVDAEDTFTAMLAHQLKALGLRVTLLPWTSVTTLPEGDLLVFGPGPGDPSNLADPKMAALHRLAGEALEARRPLFAVCLGQQILASLLGLSLARRDSPYQGLAREVDLFGTVRRVGFYSSFSAVSDEPVAASPYGPVELAVDPSDRTVHALRGPGFAGVQFHPESVLSRDGVDVLRELLPPLLSDVVSPALPG
ncbi:phenazine biosynthesis protein phzE [Actinoplanes campanulatus]|uniref:anthranilate synthase n=1 Tax=Actinoplanes campanulatus TaxID=113559 RepID=A0A7W5FCY2_9ACTN|nr:anthranilate synthase family protein [Actinoplanes campanulatus]MBB3093746.1 phenazine biosynthesis protein phzE [Actinoplanes campanulatus]GGN05372.1 phenazine-specific anthranilate synthase component I [Actinoplanes campanulatus]GID35176.1 phenazine-specific anthranilate synthase component I [Actinoplanes campanulatus]